MKVDIKTSEDEYANLGAGYEQYAHGIPFISFKIIHN